MTVKTKLQQTIADAESLHSQLISHARETQQQDVRKMYQHMAEDVEKMLPHLKGRLGHVQDEEPQYR